MDRRILDGLTYLAAAMSLGYHVDHVIRDNAVGWPLSREINRFTARAEVVQSRTKLNMIGNQA
jgi:hypothetical protein